MSQLVTIESNHPDEERKENLVDDMNKCVISNYHIQKMMSDRKSFYSFSKSYWQVFTAHNLYSIELMDNNILIIAYTNAHCRALRVTMRVRTYQVY